MSMVDISATERRLAERVDPAITNALAVSDRAGGVQFANAGEVMEWAKMMSVASSGVRKHLRGNPGACLAICVQAVEWGMSAYAVANKSYFVNDQIAFESQLIQAVILKRAPIKGRLKFEFTGEGDNRVCRAWARLRDDPDEIVEYVSPPFKNIHPKNSPLWKADPDQQHCYYSGRALCRRHFPDVLLGVYADDEFVAGAPAIGADKAHDVTPAKSMAAKLDALASPTRRPAPPVDAIDHDPNTGEITDPPAADAAGNDLSTTRGSDASSQEDRTAASTRLTPTAKQQSDGAGAEKPASASDDPEKAALMETLRSKAKKGGSAALKRALSGLVPAQNEMLTSEDRIALGDIASEADARSES